MAFPAVAATATTAYDNTSSTSRAISLPSGVTAGDLLLMVVRPVRTTTISAGPSGWSLLGSVESDGTTYVYWRMADGSEGGTASITTAAAGRIAAVTYRIDGVDLIAPEFGGAAGVTPPRLTPTFGAADTLWIAGRTSNRSDWTPTDPPNNYTGLVFATQASNTGVDRNGVATAHRQHAAASESPGAFTISGATSGSQSFTIGIKGAASGQPIVKRFGGVPFMGGMGVGNRGPGRAWG